jgi:hypothetical protein
VYKNVFLATVLLFGRFLQIVFADSTLPTLASWGFLNSLKRMPIFSSDVCMHLLFLEPFFILPVAINSGV